MDKAVSITSHDVVGIVRRAARERRVGHAGTLDPFATGLLVLAVGPATRLLSHITAEPKVYDAVIAFGTETDTDDSTGKIVKEVPQPSLEVLTDPDNPVRIEAQRMLTGMINQVPPSFSAKLTDGVRAYRIARSGHEVSLPPVVVRVDQWEWLGASGNMLSVRITCGGGTYIRALARDLGRALGSAAHCFSLRRVASGPASVSQAVRSDDLTPGCIREGTVPLLSPLALLTSHVHVTIDRTMKRDISAGRAIVAATDGAKAALVSEDGVLVALAERVAGDRWQPRVVLRGADD